MSGIAGASPTASLSSGDARTMDPGSCLIYQELPVPRHSDATKAAIKNAVDIVALVGEYLPLRRAGSKFKALCPFHDDHNPSLELEPRAPVVTNAGAAAPGATFLIS